MLAVRHVRGEIAFWMDPQHVELGLIVAEHVEYPDGGRPEPGDPVLCGSCGKPFWPFIEDYAAYRVVGRGE